MPKDDDGLNRADEFFYKLSTQSKFSEYLMWYRTKIGVPSGGLGKGVNWEKEWKRLIADKQRGVIILIAAEHFQTKFKIPIEYAPFIRFYLCFGYIPKELSAREPIKISSPSYLIAAGDIDEEKELQKYFPYESYAKILIPGTSSKNDVLKYLRDHWHEVEDVLSEQGWRKPKAVHRTVYKERNRFIRQLWRKTKEELGDKNAKYKDLLIQKILKEQGYGNINEGYIRKIGSKK